MQRPDQRDRLQPQDFLYTATEVSAAGRSTRVVGCLLDVLVAPENPLALVAHLADPATDIVTLTVTEKGYCHDPATGRLKLEHPDIAADLATPQSPRSAVGYLVAALERRRAAKQRPFTVATCDNLQNNGPLLAGLVREFAATRSRDLADWIGDNVRFPASMVDRIVPEPTPDDAAQVASACGLADAAPVVHEPFRQWVLQDQFAVRPAWETAGVQFVSDVAPFEHAKLRMLNGTHSALAYLGYLAGHETIVDTVNDTILAAYIRRLWADEIIPTLAEPPGMNLAAYASTLFERYANPAIRHRTSQIAMDGSQKLPQRLLGTLRDRLRDGGSVTLLCHAIAGWMRYVEGTDERGKPIEIRDPLAVVLAARLAVAGSAPRDRVQALMSIEQIFGTDLIANEGFVVDLSAVYSSIAQHGARGALMRVGQK